MHDVAGVKEMDGFGNKRRGSGRLFAELLVIDSDASVKYMEGIRNRPKLRGLDRPPTACGTTSIFKT